MRSSIKTVVSLVLVLYSGMGHGQEYHVLTDKKFVIIGELVWENGTKIPWTKPIRYVVDSGQPTSNNNVQDVEVHFNRMGAYPNREAGTEIVIGANAPFKDKVDIYGGSIVQSATLKRYARIEHTIQVDLSNAVRVNPTTFKLQSPIAIGTPAKLTLILVTNHLYPILEGESPLNQALKNLEETMCFLVETKNCSGSLHLSPEDLSQYFELRRTFHQYISGIGFYTSEALIVEQRIDQLELRLKSFENTAFTQAEFLEKEIRELKYIKDRFKVYLGLVQEYGQMLDDILSESLGDAIVKVFKEKEIKSEDETSIEPDTSVMPLDSTLKPDLLSKPAIESKKEKKSLYIWPELDLGISLGKLSRPNEYYSLEQTLSPELVRIKKESSQELRSLMGLKLGLPILNLRRELLTWHLGVVSGYNVIFDKENTHFGFDYGVSLGARTSTWRSRFAYWHSFSVDFGVISTSVTRFNSELYISGMEYLRTEINESALLTRRTDWAPYLSFTISRTIKRLRPKIPKRSHF